MAALLTQFMLFFTSSLPPGLLSLHLVDKNKIIKGENKNKNLIVSAERDRGEGLSSESYDKVE